jgi:ParB family chromosome partitioning protein
VSKYGLGKGLGALIPEHQQYFEPARPEGSATEVITLVPIGKLKPNPDQPRKTFPDASIDELADSIRQHGLLQPIIAEPSGDGDYIIVAGERRFRAAGRAGLATLPVIVRSVSADKRLQFSLIENIQREDLNPMEEARAYYSLMEYTGFTQEQVAEAVGKNRSTVANALRLLKLPGSMQVAVRDGVLSAGHARSLLSVADGSLRESLFARIVAEGLSVRQTEEAVAELSGPGGTRRAGKGKAKAGKKQGNAGGQGNGSEALDPDLGAFRELLIELFGTKVDIKGDMDRGTISVEYYSQEDLQRIMDALGHSGSA